MPVARPDILIPWLVDHGVWPDIPERKIKRYWNHLHHAQSELSDVRGVEHFHHPLWSWGDAAHYCKDKSVIVICFGSVLDDTKDSIQKCFPLFLCREESGKINQKVLTELVCMC